MKKLILFMCILAPSMAFASNQDLLPPDSVVTLINIIGSLPYVGPIIVMAMKWIAIIAPIMTALSVCFQVIAAIPEISARFVGAHDIADKIKYWADKVNYYLQYLSIRNAEKK